MSSLSVDQNILNRIQEYVEKHQTIYVLVKLAQPGMRFKSGMVCNNPSVSVCSRKTELMDLSSRWITEQSRLEKRL